MCNRDLNLDLNSEFAKLASTDIVGSAQAATSTSHKDWCEIKAIDVSVQNGLSSLLPLSRDQKQKRENEKTKKLQSAFQKYYEHGEPRKSDHQTELIEIHQI